MRIGQWSIASTKRSILNGAEIEAAEKALSLPLPEMTFGNNSLVLTFEPSGFGSRASIPVTSAGPDSSASTSAPDSSVAADSQIRLAFDTLTALGQVATGEGWEDRVGGGVLVSMAEKWSKRVLSDIPLSTKPTFRPSETHEIPLALLARQDPVLDRILFYDDVALFEDELHDNGESILNARIRVMPHSFFILSRLFVRVDNVLFRIYDVRVYHEFGSNEIIRECSGLEADYDEVKLKQTDLSPLDDANFVYQALGKITAAKADQEPSTPSKRGKPWPGLGRRVEVLTLPGEVSVESASKGIEQMAL
ncbi:uncharacterized protein EHS24_002701 [Apiotrichum porosum]|uniref:TIP41-like protein n=1 Tax=Apiotrichum porosum TaxID=105984 RepID=A0A427XHK4_9TREE|nr:uncharacterized protein EHS24_002701 [Apiotrichum porosum]RSH78237.1 hypothetical protein EHS24_002701 [Apiotrichum porosum]